MKKALSLVLALAMVLTMMPAVFAAEPEPQMVYNLAEAFEVDATFTGDPTVDYPNGSLTPKVANDGTGNWQIGGYNQGGGYTNLLRFSRLHRLGWYSRAYGDDKNTTLNLKEGAVHSTVRIPMMVWTEYAAIGAFPTTTLKWHYEGGAESVYGDGGYGITDPNCYTGSLGYGFGSGARDFNSATGYQTQSGAIQQAAVFTAPRAGYVNAKLIAKADYADTVAFRLEKIDGAGTRTIIYPTTGDNLVSINPVDAAYPIPAEYKDNWSTLLATLTTYNDRNIWVEEGDKLEIRFAPVGKGGENRNYSLDTLEYTYLTDIIETGEAFYREDTRKVDFNGLTGLPAAAIYSVAEDSGLTPTEEKGIFTVAPDFVSGTVVPVTVTYGGMTITLNATVKVLQMTYDLAEAFYTTNTFTTPGDTDYPTTGLTPKMANDGTSIWTVGHFRYTNLETLVPYKSLRPVNGYRAYEDNVNTSKKLGLTWNTDEYSSPGYATENRYWAGSNGRIGGLGYHFSSGLTGLYTSATGWQSAGDGTSHQAAVFTAPRAGIIVPTLKAIAQEPGVIAYRMYKKATDGTITQIYPLSTQDSVTLLHASLSYDNTTIDNNWGILPHVDAGTGLLTQNSMAVSVNPGDQIITRFSAYKAESRVFGLDTLTMTYTEQFGDNEPLFEAPFSLYDEEYYAYFGSTEPTIDMTRAILNPEAKGSMRYTLTDPEGTLRATATPGIYQIVKPYANTPATLQADYFSPNMEVAAYSTSTTVKVVPYTQALPAFTKEALPFSNFGFADGYLLPYFENTTERTIYGVIDLGLTDEWKNATATFDRAGVEYLGNGRVVATANWDWKAAGGIDLGNDGDGTYTASNGKTYKNMRSKKSTGTPIVMTLTAPDGGVKQVSFWTFKTSAAKLDRDADAVAEAYSVHYATYAPNAIMALESYYPTATGFGFDESYRDSAFWGGDIGATVANKSAIMRGQLPRIGDDGGYWHGAASQGYWENYVSETPFLNYDGVAWRFTAPRDGNVVVDSYSFSEFTFPSYHGTGKKLKGADALTTRVIKYALDGTATTLLEKTYSCDDVNLVLAQTSTEVVKNTEAASFAADGKITVSLKKGEIIRVLFGSTASSEGGYITFPAANTPNPSFTYQSAGMEDFAPADGGLAATFYVPNFLESMPAAEDLLVLGYDANGNCMGAQKSDGSWMMDNFTSTEETGYMVTLTGLDAKPTYAKIFFWNDLGNIQPLMGDVILF